MKGGQTYEQTRYYPAINDYVKMRGKGNGVISKVEFLGKLPIFSDLYPDEIEALAQITDEYEFEQGAAIAYQRDVADEFYIVRSGRLFAQRVDERGIVRESRAYMPGDYFKDVWLFTPLVHDATINAADSGRMLVIEQKKFLPFLVKHPEIVGGLNLSDEARYQAEHSQAALPGKEVKKLNLLTDEIVEFNERRTVWLLALQLFFPGLVWAGLTIFALAEWQADNILVAVLAAIIAAFLFILLVVLYLDWANDYFVITNKHLVHNEYNLLRFRVTVNKVPIDQVQSVEILRPNLLHTLLNTGTAKITTAAQSGIILFDFIDDPTIVKNIINTLRERVRAMDAGRAQAVMRASIEEHFEAPPILNKVQDPNSLSVEDLSAGTSLGARLYYALGSRVEEGNVITYRKHFFTLLVQTWWQILLVTLLLVGIIFVTQIFLAVAMGILAIIILVWFIWRFEDWRNDTFQVTDRYVIDIDRQPFGFGESRKQAELGNVQNVNADRPGFLATVFNFGNVHIETAGSSANITFERVVNPSRVQSDIFNRREQFAQKKRFQEGQQRRKELAVFMDAYQQASEQRRLPERRTPPGEF
jgi:CRP-like cAMP-binding protein/membrane protein YdbS with pleckstrin-like domain